MNVRLHIDRLVLDGFATGAGDRPRIQRAFEAELARLIAENGLSPDLTVGGALPSLAVPQMSVARDAKPAQIGAAIASALYGGLGGRR